MADYLALAKEAFDSSTMYLEANYRPDWEYSLKAFRGEHASGSKYLSDDYKSRSRIVSSKTRSIIRKNEAAAMQAAFSNREMVSCEPQNPENVMSVASAEAMKEVMQYRLTKTIPTFEIYLGGVQDAQTTGVVCSYQYWEYEQGKKKKDRPCIELRPPENLRFDAGASWLDPVNSSPYFVDIIPMYVCDVKAMMKREDPKTKQPKWKPFEDSVILQASPDVMDAVRRARLGNKQDPQTEKTSIKNFDIVWVMRWFMRGDQNEDMIFYTLGTNELLSDAVPVEDVYFHGVRPYVMGYSILEAHKVIKTSMPTLVKSIQVESTEIRNQRLDNVKFVLNKRWLVARGRQVDVQSLVRNVPGGVTLTTDPKNDVQESNWPDVTSSAFVEHDRLNAEFDDLAGNFSPSTKVANNAVNDTLGGSKLAAAGAGLMTEYLLHTINVTWWEKVLRQLALLEQYYETDEVVLAICAEKAQLFPRFGLSQITDEMLMNECTINVDMAMGDPGQRLQKFMMATQAAIGLRQNPVPGFNINEATKEIYSNAGYRDGGRFFDAKVDPQVQKLMQMVQQLKGALEGKQMELQHAGQLEQAKLQSNEKIKGAQLQVDQARISGDLQIRQAELVVEQQKLELEKLKLQIEANGQDKELSMRVAELQSNIEQAQVKLEGERQKIAGTAAKMQGDLEQARLELEHSEIEHVAKMSETAVATDNESKISEVASKVMEHMQGISSEIDAIKAGLAEATGTMKEHASIIGQGMSLMMQPKKKPSGFAFKKDGKKTHAVVVSFDDGSTEEMPVQ